MTDETPTTASTDEQNAGIGTADSTPTAPTDDDALLEGLADHTVALSTTDPMVRGDDLDDLPDAFTDARVVALGEATHGTREFFRVKHQILRYLVTEHDARTFALEANFSEALALDEYVVHGRGDPEAALEGVYFWTWQTEEILAMVEWLRAFNEDRPLGDRVRFYGFDAQYTQGAVDALRQYFATVDADFLNAIGEELDRVDDEGVPPQQDDLVDRVVTATHLVPRIRAQLTSNRAAYVEDASETAWELARQHLRVVDQATTYKVAIDDWQDADDEPAVIETVLRVRDQAMAQNVEWITDRSDAPLVVWAHDAHVNREAHVHRDTGASAPSMGRHLAASFGEAYFAFGFAFGRGGFQSVGPAPDADGQWGLRGYTLPEPISGTVEETLSELDVPLGLLDIDAAAEDDRTAAWIASPPPKFSLGAVYDPGAPEDYLTSYTLSEAFDTLCYVDETTRARPLNRD